MYLTIKASPRGQNASNHEMVGSFVFTKLVDEGQDELLSGLEVVPGALMSSTPYPSPLGDGYQPEKK